MTRKKQLESHFANLVLKATGESAGASIKPSERPDFIVEDGSDRLGIEVIRILDKPQKKEDAERENVANEAMALAKANGMPPLQVSILFSTDPPLTRANKMAMAHRVAEIVAANVPPNHGYCDWKNDWTDLSATPEKIVSITILRLPDSADPCWYPLSAGWLNSDFAPLLQEKIDEKGKDLQDYRDRCVRFWLIVAAEGFQPSSLFSFSDTMGLHVFRSPFERVFFVEGFGGRVDELKLITATSALRCVEWKA